MTRDPLLDVNDHRQDDYYDGRDLTPLGTRPSGTGGVCRVTQSIGGGACWCGDSFGHDWPGKRDGRPHPAGNN